MKALILLLFLSGLSFGQYYSTQIDSGDAKTSAFYIQKGFFDMITVTIDTPWTTANLGFERYNSKLGKWCEVRDSSGAIEYTVGALTTPTTIFIQPTHFLHDSLKIVSQVSAVDSVQAQDVTIIYQKR